MSRTDLWYFIYRLSLNFNINQYRSMKSQTLTVVKNFIHIAYS